MSFINDPEATCMICMHSSSVVDDGYCPYADKECELETPAYDCPYFEYSDHYLAALGLMKKKGDTNKQNSAIDKEVLDENNEELTREQDNTIDINESDLKNRGNSTFAVIVFFFCVVSIALAVSHADGEFEVASDIVIGIIITIILIYLAYKG